MPTYSVPASDGMAGCSNDCLHCACNLPELSKTWTYFVFFQFIPQRSWADLYFAYKHCMCVCIFGSGSLCTAHAVIIRLVLLSQLVTWLKKTGDGFEVGRGKRASGVRRACTAD